MIRKDFERLGEHYFEERLENGLLIRVIEKPGFARKYAFMATDFGSNDTSFLLDGVRCSTPAGVAHYLEHKMFDLPEGNAMEMFAKLAGSNNAFTSYAMTAYYVSCTDHFEENLSVLLRLVTTPYFMPESVEKERGIIAQEIRMYEDSPDSAVQENLMAAMYHHHPIRVGIAGTVESIQEITAEMLNTCHKAFYDPSNMMLCVIGDVDAQAVIEQVRRETPPSCEQKTERDYGQAEPLTVVEPRVEARMEVSMPTFAIGFKAEPAKSPEESMRMEIIGELAAEILAGESAPLYTKLYEQQLIDSDFSMGFESMKGMAMLEAYGDSEDPDAVLQALEEEAARIVEQGVEEKQFVRLKKSMLGRRLRDLDSFEGVCYRTCAYYFEGTEYLDYPQMFDTVTSRDVELFLKQTVQKERAAISVIYPKEV